MRLNPDRPLRSGRPGRTAWHGVGRLAAVVLVLSALHGGYGPAASAQESIEATGPVPIGVDQIAEIMNEDPSDQAADSSAPSGIDLLTLVANGGAFMIPIGAMSLLVVALAVERFLTLRRRKIIPESLVNEINELTEPGHSFDPARAYQSCANQRSVGAHVATAMLMRTGQPLADVERSATETIEREADRLAAPIRWLSLAAAATPLMGLLGTVWGMIVAFHESTTLTADRSRSEQLSEGIYTALVTTLAGLVVAIPAAMLALYLENRLAKLMRKVEQFAFDFAPAIGRFQNRQQLDSQGRLQPIQQEVMPPPTDGHSASPAPPRTGTRPNRGDTKRVS